MGVVVFDDAGEASATLRLAAAAPYLTVVDAAGRTHAVAPARPAIQSQPQAQSGEQKGWWPRWGGKESDESKAEQDGGGPFEWDEDQ